MSETDPADTTPDPAAAVESEMDAELGALRAKGPAPGSKVRNPVFQHEQRTGTAVDAAEGTLTAARVSGEMAAEADQDRLKIEAEVARIEQQAPGSSQALDAEAASARAERDADEAVAKSLDSDVAADDARSSEGSGMFHRGADPATAVADKERALADESVVGRDLTDLDALAAEVEADAAGLPPASS
jgi:hypothetical protein